MPAVIRSLVFCQLALHAATLPVAEATSVATPATSVATPVKLESVQDLHQQYYNVFGQHGNRNAASHLWSSFLIDRAAGMTPEKFSYLSTGYCAVSGSPVQPQDRTRYRLNLQLVGGGRRTGFLYYCCWPCVCDTQDFIKVDTKTITLAGGEVRQYHFAVIGNPCEKPDELSRPFFQNSMRGETTLQQVAPNVECDSQAHLKGAHLSDHGYIIISMFFDEDSSQKSNDESEFADHCAQRKAQGYNSGMGEIFRKVSGISPVHCAANLPPPSLDAPDGTALIEE